MNRVFASLLIVGAVLALSITITDHQNARAVEDEKPPASTEKTDGRNSEIWMRKKLDYAQNILAGLTAGDFDQIADNARAMKGLGKVEAFVRSRNPAYTRQLHAFEGINDEIIRQANQDNAEGVALAFTQLTVNCVQCHKELRRHDGSRATK